MHSSEVVAHFSGSSREDCVFRASLVNTSAEEDSSLTNLYFKHSGISRNISEVDLRKHLIEQGEKFIQL
jgi:hypothetical protein